MKKLTLDFADRGVVFCLYHAPWRLGLAALLASLALLGGWGQWHAVHQDGLRMAQERDQLLKAQERQRPRVAAAPKLTADQFKASQAAIRQLNQPWVALLETLESTRKGRVALLELRLDSTNDRIRGVAEAKNPQEMLRFVSQMKAQPLLTSVELNLHQMSQTDPNKPYRFEFSAYWQTPEGAP
jgi:Tfp pilus assembly protein PilN